MSSAVIRVKRHIDDTPVEALRLAKRRRVGVGDPGNESDRGFVQDGKDSAPGVVLAFVGTAQKADVETIHSVIRKHHEVSTVEKDATERTSDARRRKLEILQGHKELLKRFPEQINELEGSTKRSCSRAVEGADAIGQSEQLNAGDQLGPKAELMIYDALHEDIIVNEETSVSGSNSAKLSRNPSVKSGTSAGSGTTAGVMIDKAATGELNDAGDSAQGRTVSAKDTAEVDESSVEEKFVYDIYVAQSDKDVQEHLPLDPKSYAADYVLEKIDLVKEDLMYDDEFPEDPFLCQSDEDSNDENHPNTDYPDEEDWYDDHGREREYDSTEEPDESLEEYDELGYLERRFLRIDFDDREELKAYGSDDEGLERSDFDHYAKEETLDDDCDSN